MSVKSVLLKVLGLTNTVVESVGSDPDTGGLVVSVRPVKRAMRRCGVCQRRCPGYDTGRGRRRWRGLDLGSTLVWLEADAPRVRCPRHGVVVARVPWARPGSWFTTEFEQHTTWLCVHACRSVVAQLMRIDWKTVGGIIARSQTEWARNHPSPLDNLVNIGIDETSYTKGQKYVTVIIDHDRGRVVWVGKGHGQHVLDAFFTSLTDSQAGSIQCVSADAASWIKNSVTRYCPNATQTMDPFHTVQWATDALDQVRRQAWQAARVPKPQRGRGRPRRGEEPPPDPAKPLKNARFALLKNPENLTETQQARLDLIAVNNPILYRAWRLKENLRLLLKLPYDQATHELDTWLGWAQRCRIPAFVDLQRKIRRHKQDIINAIRFGLTNARVEATNTKIKLTIRMGYGFRNTTNLIALIMLKCGPHHPTLPNRN